MTSRGQLILFPGVRRRRPSPEEFRLHCAIADTLRRSLAPRWIWLHCPNGAERPKKTTADGRTYSPEGSRLKRMGVRPGASDIFLIAPPAGRFHALEIKKRGEEPSDEQMDFLRDVKRTGGKA